VKFATKAVHAGLTPDPSYGSVIPAIHQTSTYVQPAPGEYVGDYDYARSANPTRAALETALGELEGGLGLAFSSGLAAEHGHRTAGAQHVHDRNGDDAPAAARVGCVVVNVGQIRIGLVGA
jgi:cystathionine gamma-synthase